MLRLATSFIALLAVSLLVSPAAAQLVEPRATHRVFLKDGQALPAYGESVVVDGRVVFTLLVSGTASRAMNDVASRSMRASF